MGFVLGAKTVLFVRSKFSSLIQTLSGLCCVPGKTRDGYVAALIPGVSRDRSIYSESWYTTSKRHCKPGTMVFTI